MTFPYKVQLAFLVIVVLFSISEASSSSSSSPSESALWEQACYGSSELDFIEPSCPEDSVIHVLSVSTYAKRTATGCPEESHPHFFHNESACCNYVSDTQDCGMRYIGSEYRHYTLCNGHTTCKVPASWNYTKNTCDQDIYLNRTNYMLMEYSCIPGDAILESEDNSDAIATGNSVFLWNSGYADNSAIAACAETSGSTWSVLASTGNIKIIAFDLRLANNSVGACGQQLHIIDGRICANVTCDDNNLYQTKTLYVSETSEITIRLDNTMAEPGGSFWIQFEGTIPNATLNISSRERSPAQPCQEETLTTLSPPTSTGGVSTSTSDSFTESPSTPSASVSSLPTTDKSSTSVSAGSGTTSSGSSQSDTSSRTTTSPPTGVSPSGSVLWEQACYGSSELDFIEPSCPEDSVIHVLSVSTYAKRTATGCPEESHPHFFHNESACCNYVSDTEDCGMRYIGAEYRHYTLCNGHTTCKVPASWNYTKNTCDQDIYLNRTNYMLMEYSCIPGDTILESEDNSDAIATGNTVFLWNSGYADNSAIAACAETSGSTWSVLASTGNIKIIAFDLRLANNSVGACRQQLHIIDGRICANVTCDDNNLYQTKTLYVSETSEITIRLDNTMAEPGGSFWIQFEGTIPNATLSISSSVRNPAQSCQEETLTTLSPPPSTGGASTSTSDSVTESPSTPSASVSSLPTTDQSSTSVSAGSGTTSSGSSQSDTSSRTTTSPPTGVSPSGSVLWEQACYGSSELDFIEPSCPEDSVIHVLSVSTYAKRTATGCPEESHPHFFHNESACCNYVSDTEDCGMRYIGAEYRHYTLCNGHTTCKVPTAWNYTRNTCDQDIFLNRTNYMLMEYSCVQGDMILAADKDSSTTVTDSAVYLWNSGYDASQSIGGCADTSGSTWSISASTGNVKVVALDLRLATDDAGACRQQLHITDGNFGTNITCDDNSIDRTSLLYVSQRSEISLRLDNTLPGPNGYFWIQFEGTVADAILRITQQESNPVHSCPEDSGSTVSPSPSSVSSTDTSRVSTAPSSVSSTDTSHSETSQHSTLSSSSAPTASYPSSTASTGSGTSSSTSTPLSTTTTTPRVSPSESVLWEQACYGSSELDFIEPSCPKDSVIHVLSVSTYAKRTDTGCREESHPHFFHNESACCNYVSDTEDCGMRYIGSELRHYTLCNGHRTCKVRAAWNFTRNTCDQDIFLNRTNYMLMEYSCVPENAILSIDDAPGTPVTSNAVYLWYSGYRHGQKIAPCHSTTGSTCSISASSGFIRIVGIVVQFETNSQGGCGQQLFISDGNRSEAITCHNNNNMYQTTSLFISQTSLITVRLDNTLTEPVGSFWVQFEGTDLQSSLTISCGTTYTEYDCEDIITTTRSTPVTDVSSTVLTSTPTPPNLCENARHVSEACYGSHRDDVLRATCPTGSVVIASLMTYSKALYTGCNWISDHDEFPDQSYCCGYSGEHEDCGSWYTAVDRQYHKSCTGQRSCVRTVSSADNSEVCSAAQFLTKSNYMRMEYYCDKVWSLGGDTTVEANGDSLFVWNEGYPGKIRNCTSGTTCVLTASSGFINIIAIDLQLSTDESGCSQWFVADDGVSQEVLGCQLNSQYYQEKVIYTSNSKNLTLRFDNVLQGSGGWFVLKLNGTTCHSSLTMTCSNLKPIYNCGDESITTTQMVSTTVRETTSSSLTSVTSLTPTTSLVRETTSSSRQTPSTSSKTSTSEVGETTSQNSQTPSTSFKTSTTSVRGTTPSSSPTPAISSETSTSSVRKTTPSRSPTPAISSETSTSSVRETTSSRSPTPSTSLTSEGIETTPSSSQTSTSSLKTSTSEIRKTTPSSNQTSVAASTTSTPSTGETTPSSGQTSFTSSSSETTPFGGGTSSTSTVRISTPSDISTRTSITPSAVSSTTSVPTDTTLCEEANYVAEACYGSHADDLLRLTCPTGSVVVVASLMTYSKSLSTGCSWISDHDEYLDQSDCCSYHDEREDCGLEYTAADHTYHKYCTGQKHCVRPVANADTSAVCSAADFLSTSNYMRMSYYCEKVWSLGDDTGVDANGASLFLWNEGYPGKIRKCTSGATCVLTATSGFINIVAVDLQLSMASNSECSQWFVVDDGVSQEVLGCQLNSQYYKEDIIYTSNSNNLTLRFDNVLHRNGGWFVLKFNGTSCKSVLSMTCTNQDPVKNCGDEGITSASTTSPTTAKTPTTVPNTTNTTTTTTLPVSLTSPTSDKTPDPVSEASTPSVSTSSQTTDKTPTTDRETTPLSASTTSPTTDKTPVPASETSTHPSVSKTSSTSDKTPTPLRETTIPSVTAISPTTYKTNTPVSETTTPSVTTIWPPTDKTPTPVSETTTPSVTTISPPTDKTRTPVSETTTPSVTTIWPPTDKTPTPVSETTTPSVTTMSPPTDKTRTPVSETTTPSVTTISPPTDKTRTPVSETTTPSVTTISPPTDNTPTPVSETTTSSVSTTILTTDRSPTPFIDDIEALNPGTRPTTKSPATRRPASGLSSNDEQPNETAPQEQDSSSNYGLIAGIVVGLIVGVCLVIVSCYVWCRHRTLSRSVAPPVGANPNTCGGPAGTASTGKAKGFFSFFCSWTSNTAKSILCCTQNASTPVESCPSSNTGAGTSTGSSSSGRWSCRGVMSCIGKIVCSGSQSGGGASNAGSSSGRFSCTGVCSSVAQKLCICSQGEGGTGTCGSSSGNLSCKGTCSSIAHKVCFCSQSGGGAANGGSSGGKVCCISACFGAAKEGCCCIETGAGNANAQLSPPGNCCISPCSRMAECCCSGTTVPSGGSSGESASKGLCCLGSCFGKGGDGCCCAQGEEDGSSPGCLCCIPAACSKMVKKACCCCRCTPTVAPYNAVSSSRSSMDTSSIELEQTDSVDAITTNSSDAVTPNSSDAITTNSSDAITTNFSDAITTNSSDAVTTNSSDVIEGSVCVDARPQDFTAINMPME